MSQFRFSGNHKKGYTCLEDYTYYSKRYNRYKTIKKDDWSDGATGFVDLGAEGYVARVFNWFRQHIHKLSDKITPLWYFVHDAFCESGEWDAEVLEDGTVLPPVRISNWDASTVAGDILWNIGYRFWSIPVWFFTFIGGGGEAKKNGWFRVKKEKI